jgi:oligoribonuclease
VTALVTTYSGTVTSANPVQDRIVWIDCEMTGLSLATDALIEIAVVVTDSELRLLDPGLDLVIAPPPAALEQMEDVVRDMHVSSGLLDDLASGISLDEATAQVLDYITTWVPEPRRAPLAGNSIATDRAFLERDMPTVSAHLHYRMIDVSSIKELARRWYPRVYFHSPAKQGGHRALADILESISELRYYRAALFPQDPGPDTPTARRVSAQVVAAGNVFAPSADVPDSGAGPARSGADTDRGDS